MEITEQFSRRKPVKAQIEGLVSLLVHGTVMSVLFCANQHAGVYWVLMPDMPATAFISWSLPESAAKSSHETRS